MTTVKGRSSAILCLLWRHFECAGTSSLSIFGAWILPEIVPSGDIMFIVQPVEERCRDNWNLPVNIVLGKDRVNPSESRLCVDEDMNDARLGGMRNAF